MNEAANIAPLVAALSALGVAAIVVDNGSTDDTAAVARAAGATVVSEPIAGYGRACKSGLQAALEADFDVIAFMDADGSDPPHELVRLVEALEGYDVVLGTRPRFSRGWRAMPQAQKFGNWLAPLLLRLTTGARYADMPSFKVFSREALLRLAPQDETYGFTIELLVRAHALGLRVTEVPIDYRPRAAGESKVSGDLRASAKAAVRILSVVGRYAWEAKRRRR
ncbi:MAG: glycosyltransferase family 2 protein [Myxococcales bacterium]|nr:glycosyltransferase family 2 protein [Myxococcales bacterium]